MPSVIILFLAMLALAAMPSASVALVVTRSATLGISNGVAVIAGIVVGDLVFVSLAVLGMSVLADTMGALFAVFKYIGGGYLIWMGIGLLRAQGNQIAEHEASHGSSLLTSFASGLFLTLGDVKAILFYASLFPTFVDMTDLTATSIVTIIIITILTVGGVKLAYAFAARRIISRMRSSRAQKSAGMTAGGLMVGAGAYLIIKT